MNTGTGEKKKTVVIAGATGFVGSALLRVLQKDFCLVALTRQLRAQNKGEGVEWRHCDIFSLIQCEEALSGADSAFYLVHSMLPSAHLTQGHFEDMDLILADNFARSAWRAGISQIIYLGGLIPPGEIHLSRHLRSRLEVEETLGARGVPVTALRAGMIIGAGGASFCMLKEVVRRLWLIPCPKELRSLAQPIALDDVLRLLRYVLEHPVPYNRSFDIGSPDVLTYRQLLERMAGILGKKRFFFDIPGTRWYKPLLALVSGNPLKLVSPLIESMRHSMVARERYLQQEAGIPGIPLDEALTGVVAAPGKRSSIHHPFPKEASYNVRSVQRIPLPPGWSARQLADEYVSWLPKLFRFFLRARADAYGNLILWLRFPRVRLLELTFDRDRSVAADRQLFYITGGFLVRRSDRTSRRPRLEFRELLQEKCVLVAIHDYKPTIPWPLYNLTQALAHIWVMRRFSRHVRT